MTESAVIGSLEDRVTSFVAEELCIQPHSFSAASTLQRDLGLDGYDAVEFFEKFSEEFHVDIAPLNLVWDRHFGPEAVPATLGLWVIVVFVVAAVAAGAIHVALGNPPVSLTFPILTAAGVIFVWRQWRKRHPITEITVGELAQAARLGRWPEEEAH